MRRFGITMAGGFTLITLLIAARHHHSIVPTWSIAVVFLVLGLLIPRVLAPVYTGWMCFGKVLGWINTRILLSAMFYLIFTPIAFALKLLRKDLLDLRFKDGRNSYWIKRPDVPFRREDYEHQF
jgi:hypothetical protein